MTKAEIQQVKLRFGIIGNNEALMRAIDIAIQVAPTDLSVLITGESGVGKESFPQIIHQYSRRKHGQYIAVNCGAIPEGTIDSELFGHEKGAFTGAIGERKGYFGEADGGTIFLDEVGELPMPTQARLLRVLETGEFIKVGSSKVEKTNVRIVAATNVNLTQAIADGRFREDLYYRLNTVPIQVPALRERGEDVVLLFRKFASDFAEKYRMPAIQLTEDAKHIYYFIKIQVFFFHNYPPVMSQILCCKYISISKYFSGKLLFHHYSYITLFYSPKESIACFRSAIRSFLSSIPADRRRTLSVIPFFIRISSGTSA